MTIGEFGDRTAHVATVGTMKAYLTRRYWFSASHRLHNPRLSDDENLRVYGKCNNPYGHGHNYGLEVRVGGPVDPATGMVCDVAALDAVVQREILDRFDHQNLNTVPEFADCIPTSENLAAVIFKILQRTLGGSYLDKVKLHETSMNTFEYGADAESHGRDVET